MTNELIPKNTPPQKIHLLRYFHTDAKKKQEKFCVFHMFFMRIVNRIENKLMTNRFYVYIVQESR